jgi:CBS domain containing-hemolysin-like protein
LAATRGLVVRTVLLGGAGIVLLTGWATIAYVNEQLGLSLATDGPFETVAGLIHHQIGRLAEEGDRVELPGVALTVLDATDRRLRRVRVDWRPEGEWPAE